MVASASSILAVVGSRTLDNYELVKMELDHFFKSWYVTDIVSGGAIGADSLAERYAKEHQIPLIVIKPDYTKHGKSAPFIRNTTIAEQCDIMVAFWDGVSKGTEDVVKKTVKLGKQVIIVPTVRRQYSLDNGPEI